MSRIRAYLRVVAATLAAVAMPAVTLATATMAAVTMATTMLAAIVIGGCALDNGAPPPAVIVGNITLGRDVRDPQRYALRMEILNDTDQVLRKLTFSARARAEISGESEAGLEAPVRVALPAEIGAGVRAPVSAVLESPFLVVPPVPIVLDEIRLGEFFFSAHPAGQEQQSRYGWVQYPWPVEESR